MGTGEGATLIMRAVPCGRVDAGQHDIGCVVLETRLHSPQRGPCLAREVDAGQHEVLWVVVEHREGQVEALQEDQRRRLHLLWEAQRAAQPLPGPGTRSSCKGCAKSGNNPVSELSCLSCTTCPLAPPALAD